MIWEQRGQRSGERCRKNTRIKTAAITPAAIARRGSIEKNRANVRSDMDIHHNSVRVTGCRHRSAIRTAWRLLSCGRAHAETEENSGCCALLRRATRQMLHRDHENYAMLRRGRNTPGFPSFLPGEESAEPRRSSADSGEKPHVNTIGRKCRGQSVRGFWIRAACEFQRPAGLDRAKRSRIVA